ncbi:acyl-CoA dehydrogenase family protein [Dermacoccus nishinomiyaensis]|uniref:acyl-CoA dehydrogenase family protein n=1 Tax=Dermacoccus nishinomiyaensis TaxID=1274 RepID=UPI0028A142E3|nr:acyl-CoA dehydrogenase family protein [Dermacoccus nishinomiyaensis]
MTDVFALTPTNQADVMAGFDAVDADEALKDAASAFASHEHADVLGPLRELGVMAGSEEAREHGMAANTFTPRHRAVDRFGARTDAVEFHPSWHWLMRRGVEFGLAGAPWQDASADAHLRRAAGFITWSGVEPGHVCPLTMTYAAVPALRADEALTQRYADGLAASVYEPGDLPAASKEGLLAGMGMTEKQGGSDVRTNVTEATPAGFDDDGAAVYSLRGHKWFTSAPTNDLFLVLAQAPGGLTCFVVPRVHPDGTRNALRIVRLKDKLGNRSNASSELEFHDAYATRLGDEGAGVRTIIEMVSATRLDCVLGSAGLMRRATSEAAWYTARRHAFGGVLADKPAMQNVLADLAIESEAATALGMRLAASVDRIESGDPGSEHERAFRRFALPLAKFWVCKRTPMHVAEALECLGGNGYVEESGMPLLFRESPLNSIWEGSGSVNALDVLRALTRSPEAFEAFSRELDVTRGDHPGLDVATKQVLADVVSLTPDDAEYRARDISARMAVVLQASLLLRSAPSSVSDAFIASRVQGEWGGVFGTLGTSAASAAIARRATPRP